MIAIKRRNTCRSCQPGWLWLMLFLTIGTSGLGCAMTPYRYGRFHETTESDGPVPKVPFVFGQPNKTVDRIAMIASAPSRILPLSSKVSNHALSEETAEKLQTYLEENDLADVLVRVNQYDPLGEWDRLRENTRIAPGWRYTFGTASLLGYTLFPGRIFGGDHYNPFSNSLHVNSDVPALLMAESAYAKDLHSRRWAGAYAVINEFPILSAWRYSIAARDVVGYARLKEDDEIERELYRVVYPIIGVQIALGGHSAASLLTSMPLMALPISALGGALGGHAVGQMQIAIRERQRNAESVQHRKTLAKYNSRPTDW